MASPDGSATSPAPGEEVVRWLRSHGVGLATPATVELVAGGRSNLTYILTAADGQRVVLRRPPVGGVLETAHDMNREWRFLTALRSSSIPVPEPLARDPRGELLGAPFFVMSFVEGLVLHDATDASELPLPARHHVATELIDIMAALHRVDIDEVGLGDMVRREGYIERQLRRWRRQWEQSVATDITSVAAVHAHLSRIATRIVQPAIVHGDFRLGNMICDSDGRIKAVLDWELATLGDPLADLGWLLAFWPEAGERTPIGQDPPPPSILDGFPSRRWLTDRYCARSGADVSAIKFYVAFAHWRSACISAGVLTRYQSGVMADDGFSFQDLRRSITERADAALTLLESGGT
jgi:aminoglycoside phosphotransferase (APT) family kinase protein